MSERGQKIFKIVVWSVIVLYMLIFVLRIVYAIMNPAITLKQWYEMVAETMDVQVDITDDNIELTGKEVAESLGSIFSFEQLMLLSSEIEETEEKEAEATEEDAENSVLVKIAIANKIIKEDEVNRGINEKRAKEIANRISDLYYDPEIYPSYSYTTFGENVVQAFDWDIEKVNEDATSMEVTYEGQEPQKGQIIVYTQENGLANARKILDYKQIKDNKYELDLGDISDISEVIDSVDFSGCGDFQYIEKQSEQKSDKKKSGSMIIPNEVQAKSFDKATKKADIEVSLGIEYGDKIEKKGKDGKKKVSRKKKGVGSIKVNNVEVDSDIPGLKEKKAEIGDTVGKISGTITITDLCVDTKGKWNFENNLDANNKAEIAINGNIDTDLTLEGDIEDEIKLADIDIPIEATGGVVSVNLKICMQINADGKISYHYYVNGFKCGMNFSIKNGLKPIKQADKKGQKIQAEVEVKFGPAFTVSVDVLKDVKIAGKDCTITLVDPGIDAFLVGKYGTEIPEPGYETYLPCETLSIYGPEITLQLTRNNKSVVGEVLKRLEVGISIEIINEDNAPIKLAWHTEYDKNGKSKTLKGGSEVCTHKQKPKSDKKKQDKKKENEKKSETVDSIPEGQDSQQGVVIEDINPVEQAQDQLQDAGNQIQDQANDMIEQKEQEIQNQIEETLTEIMLRALEEALMQMC